jgi:hypothetical protein
MAEGNDTYKGLAQPLTGNFEQYGISTTEDMMTLTQVSGASGDFIVCQTSAGTEVFVVTVAGAMTVAGELTLSAGATIPAAQYLNWAATVSTAPTTGLEKGDMMLIFSTSSPVLAVCTSTAGKTIKYISPFDTKTMNRTT